MKKYKSLSWQEKRALGKEYNTINPRPKSEVILQVMFAIIGLIGFVLQGIGLATAGQYSDSRLALIGWIMFGSFAIYNGIILKQLKKRSEAFLQWLKESKGIEYK